MEYKFSIAWILLSIYKEYRFARYQRENICLKEEKYGYIMQQTNQLVVISFDYSLSWKYYTQFSINETTVHISTIGESIYICTGEFELLNPDWSL